MNRLQAIRKRAEAALAEGILVRANVGGNFIEKVPASQDRIIGASLADIPYLLELVEDCSLALSMADSVLPGEHKCSRDIDCEHCCADAAVTEARARLEEKET